MLKLYLIVKCKAKYGVGLKIWTAKEMAQRLPIALAQVKAGDNSENVLNEIRQIAHSLYQSKVYNNIIFSWAFNTLNNETTWKHRK